LIQQLSRNETLVLIIDEAQNLSKEALEDLRLLSNLETERFKPLQIILAGRPELEEKLNSKELRQFRQRIGIRLKILPLTGEESRRYIAHRLNKVESSPQKIFMPKAVSLICHHARGIPRVINTLCERSFLIGYAKARKPIDEKIVNEVLGEMRNAARKRKGASGEARKAYPS
jgi:general secretion pathway protein A